jgi:alginate O-acetyltransferase complex protein AlgI
MGIGIGRMLGFSFPEHFDHPFTAYTISDFWSRWQITLVGFFQKYLSNPLGDTQKTGWKEILKMLGVWLLLGLWQGPSWSYVLWGLYFWALLVLEEFALWPFLEKAPWALRRILTQILVFLSFALLFCGELENLPALLLGLVGRHGLVSKAFFTTLICQAPILILGIVAATNLGKRLRKKLSLMAKQGGPALVVDSLWEAIHPVALLLLSAMALAGVTSNPFLMIQL